MFFAPGRSRVRGVATPQQLATSCPADLLLLLFLLLFSQSPLAWDDWSFGRLAWGQGPTRRGPFGSLADDACERIQLENHSWIRELRKIDGSSLKKNWSILVG